MNFSVIFFCQRRNEQLEHHFTSHAARDAFTWESETFCRDCHMWSYRSYQCVIICTALLLLCARAARCGCELTTPADAPLSGFSDPAYFDKWEYEKHQWQKYVEQQPPVGAA